MVNGVAFIDLRKAFDTVNRDNMQVSVPAGATAEFMTTKDVASILDNPLSRAKEGK